MRIRWRTSRLNKCGKYVLGRFLWMTSTETCQAYNDYIDESFLHPADKYEKHGADESHGKPDKNLCKRMLAQHNAACPDSSGEQQQSAERPYRIEIEQIAESNDASRQSARATVCVLIFHHRLMMTQSICAIRAAMTMPLMNIAVFILVISTRHAV